MSDKEKSRKGKRKLQTAALSVVFALSLSVFLYSAYQIFSYYREGNQQKESVNQMVEEAVRPLPVTSVEQEEWTEENETVPSLPPFPSGSSSILSFPDISVDLEKLSASYPDLVGWLYQPNGDVNLPVMQAKDNNYYLRRLPNGTKNNGGSLFLDFIDNKDLSGWNSVIYGHNMRNGTMFSFLHKFRTQEYYNANPFLFYFTKNGIYRAEIFAGVITDSTSSVYSRPQTDSEKEAYLKEVRENSLFTTDFSVEAGEKILLLSTCSSTTRKEERLVIFAKLVLIKE